MSNGGRTTGGVKSLKVEDFDYIEVNGKRYYPEYEPDEGECAEILIRNYSVDPNKFLDGEFVASDRSHYLKSGSWVPNPRYKK